MDLKRTYRIVRRVGRHVLYNGHVYTEKSYYKAKQRFETLADKQDKHRLRWSWITKNKKADRFKRS